MVRQVLLATKIPKNLPSGPIHVDIKPENVLVNKGEVTGVLDFDNTYIGPYIIDIGKTIFWFCIKQGKLNKQLFSQFIKSYEQKRRLTPIERKFLGNAINYAIASHIYVDYYRYCYEKTTPYKYLKMLLKEFYPVLVKNNL